MISPALLSPVATVLLVPPVNLVVLALAGLLLARRWPAAGRRLAAAALLLLLLLALPAVSVPLLVALEGGLATPPASAVPRAIVVLGGDVRAAGTLPDDQDIGALSLERVRVAAALAHTTRLPVLVTGGMVSATGDPVAVLMAASLTADFGIAAPWVERASRTTWENATYSAAILRGQGISTVLLVTHAWHMRRALIAFRAAGILAIPAPVKLDREPRFGPADFVPRVSSWQIAYFALHEWIGCAWYAMLAARHPAPA